MDIFLLLPSDAQAIYLGDNDVYLLSHCLIPSSAYLTLDVAPK